LIWAKKGVVGTDAKNRVAALRGRPLCGLPVFSGARAGKDGAWNDGMVYDPDSGKSYGADLHPAGGSKLELRVRFGVMRYTDVWVRGEPPARCAAR
jgi:uncharacterized protein (DUF2147 family)